MINRLTSSHMAAGIALGLVLLAVGGALVNPVLVPAMLILVVLAGIILDPPRTAVLAALATVLALLAVPFHPTEDGILRVIVVLAGGAVAVLLSWVLSRRVQHIEALRAREASILASVADAVVVLDSAGRIERANPALARLVPGAIPGAALHPLLGHRLADDRACPGGCALDGRLPTDPAGHGPDAGCIAPAGRRIPIEFSIGEIDKGTLVLTIRDISDRVTADADRRALIQEAARLEERGAMLRAMTPEQGRPTAPGLEFDVWIGADHQPNGDLVDVREMPDGAVLMLVVGAQGEPLPAARDARRVLYVARVHLLSGVPMADLVLRTASTLAGEPDAPVASLLAAVLDPDTGLLTVVSGGHPPALLVHRAGTAEWVQSMGQGLGSRQPGSANLVTGTLEVGDSLVLYSGGTLDHADPLAGMSAMRAAAVALRNHPTNGWAARLVHALGTDRAPRTTLLVARLAPGSAAPSAQPEIASPV